MAELTRKDARRMKQPLISNPISVLFYFILLTVSLPREVEGQNDLTPTVTPAAVTFLESQEYVLICTLTTGVSGSFPGSTPLAWTSSAGALPVGYYTVPSSDPQGLNTVYKLRLVLKPTRSLSGEELTCSASIGTHTGSVIYPIKPVVVYPDRPVLTGPVVVKAGESNRWTCVSTGATIKGANTYFRNAAGQSLTRTVSQSSSITTDAGGINLFYEVISNLDTSLPPEAPQFTLKCQTVYEEGTYLDEKETFLSITVLFVPQVTKTGSDTVLTTENVRTTIPCVITSSSPSVTRVSWTKDGLPLVISFSRYEGGDVVTPSLIIKSAQQSDSGDYVCSATNSEGTGSFDTPSTLTVRYQPRFSFASGTTFTGGAGTVFTLPCDATAIPDITTIRWKRVLSGITSTIRINLEPRYSGADPITKNYGLTITTLQPSDGDGEYFCEVDNDVGTGTSPRLNIVVNDRPTVTASTTSVTVSENNQFVLSCVVVPLNTLNALRWEKDGVTLNTGADLAKYFGGNTLNPSLTIRSATDSDAGNYVCAATNDYGSTSGPNIDVTLRYKPRVAVSPTPLTSTGGNSIFLTCAVTANPDASLIYWTRNGIRIDSSATPSKYSGGTTTNPPLIIFNGDISDSGEYFCVAQNDEGTTFSRGVTVSVTNTPSVVVTPTTGVVLEGSSSHTFTCSVTSTPAATDVYWRFNGARMSVSGNPAKYSGGTLANPSLTIRNVARSDNGQYVCVATNDLGEGSSPTAQLTVTYLPTFTFNVNPIGKQVGTSVAINCQVTANPAVTSVSWEKDGVPLNTGDPLKYQGGTLGTPSLTIFKLETSDTGRYACVATNPRGTAKSPQVTLTVSSIPSVVVTPTTGVVLEGSSSHTFTCSVTSTPAATDVYWRFNGARMSVSGNPAKYSGGTLANPSLTIRNVARSDDGQYVCVATNDLGEGSSPTAQLTVTYLPTFTFNASPIGKQVGTFVTINCQVTANPAVTSVSWEKDGVPLNTGDPLKYQGGTLGTPSLTIFKLETSDTGRYACVATNPRGTAKSPQVTLTVSSQPSINTPPPSVEIEEGRSIILPCDVTPKNTLTGIAWQKDGTALDTGNAAKYSGSTTTTPALTIFNAQDADVGSYRCVATNDFGVTTGGPMALILQYKPRVNVPAGPLEVDAGNNVAINCGVDASPAPTLVYWTKDGNSQQLNEDFDSVKYSGGTKDSPSLIIRSSDFVDAGNYACAVFNTVGGVLSDRVNLNVVGVPTVTTPSTDITATEGDTDLLLTCDYLASPTPSDIYWTKGGSRLDTASQSDKYGGGTRNIASLTIKTISSSDKGQYVCNVVNTKGTGSSPIVDLKIRYKPIITVPATPITLDAGGQVRLDCTVDSNPAITQLYWTKDGDATQLSSTTNPAKYGGGTTSTPSLTILATTIADSGNYVCVAINDVDRSNSNAVQLSLEAPPTVTASNTDVTAIEGDSNLLLGCTFDANPAATSVYWTKDGSRLDTAGQPDKYSGGTKDVPGLTIKTVAPSDRGQYVCNVVNPKGTSSSPTVELDVEYKPILTVPTTPITLNAGGQVRLDCTVDSNPAITQLYWTKDGDSTQLSSTTNPAKYGGGTTSTPSLTILATTIADSGNYVCVAVNKIDVATSTAVQVGVEGVPSVSPAGDTTPIATEGDTAQVLECHFLSNPAPLDIYWTKDGSRLDTAGLSNKYTGGTKDEPDLTIDTVTASDKGRYVCNVVNAKGTGSSPIIDLSVRYKPILTVSPAPISVPVGTPVTLICNVNAHPAATSVEWTVFGAKLDISDASKYRDGTVAKPNLSILTSVLIDTGEYACVVENEIGETISSTVDVSFTSIPIVTATIPSSTIPEGSVNVVLSCDFRSVPAATSLYWTKDRSQIDISQTSKYGGGTLAVPSLTIKTIAYTDLAVYVCNVRNTVGTGVSTGGNLDVTYKPRLTVPNASITSSPGTTVILACNVNANPAPSNVYWTKGGITIDSASNPTKYRGGTKDNPTLSILSAAFVDNGEYACVSVNDNGQTTSPGVSVSITNVPVVTDSPSSTSVEAGTATLELTCSHISNPVASDLSWTKDGATLDSTKTPAKYEGGNLGSPNLIIKNIDKNDRGKYVCNVQNALGVGVSAGVTVDVTFKPDLVLPTTPVTGSTGSPVTLTCGVDSNPQPLDVYWTKDGIRINLSAILGKYSGGTLAIPSLTINSPDFSDTGDYRCNVENSVGVTTSGEVPVSIISIPSVTAAATITTVPEDATDIILTCNYQSNPAPSRLYWSKDGAEINSASNAVKYSGGTLVVPNLTIKTIKRTDKGTYICNVVNDEGTGSSLGLELDVTYAPTLTVSNTPIVAELGTSVTLTCNVDSNPAPLELYWVKSGATRIDSVTTPAKYRNGNLLDPALTILGAVVADTGDYSCVVRNSRGTTTSDPVSVSIVSVPTVTSSATVSTVDEGATNIMFTCLYTSNPAPLRLYWTRDGNEIDVVNQPGKYSGATVATPNLTIKTVARSDKGAYVCHVTNPRGTGSSSANSLDVTFKPTIAPTDTTLRGPKDGQVTLACDVTANPALRFLFWTKDGVQLNLAVPAGKYSGGTIAEPGLTIANLDETSDPATYSCTVTNDKGTTVSDPIELGVTFDPVVNIGADVTAEEGAGSLVITCDVQMFPAATSVTWTKDGNTLAVVATPSKFSGGTPSTPSLTILNAVTSDRGTYRCSANNGDVTKESGTATVTITYVPKIQNQSSKEAKVGTSVTLPCAFDASPAATLVEWKKSDTSSGSLVRSPVTGSRFTGGNVVTPSLTITSLTIADTANYYCIVTNARGASEGSVVFKTRYQPQNLDVTATPTSLNAGSRFTLTCSGDAYPAPSGFDWYRGSSNSPVSTTSTYTRNVAQPADNTNFRCAVSNDEGTASKSLSLDVKYTPITNVQGRQTVSSQSGIPVTLTCDISANPSPTSYTWYKGAAVVVNENNRTLTLLLASPSDFGDYSCTATNSLGTLNPAQEFTVTTSGGPGTGASTGDDGLSTTTIVLIVIIIIIVLIILILIIVFCCLQGTCARCCGKKDPKVGPTKPLPPMYMMNGGHFGPTVTPEANGKLKLNEDEEYFSPRNIGAGPIISVPETRGPRAHHLPPLNMETPSAETPGEEKRRSRRKKRRRRHEDETHLTGDKGEEEVVVTNTYSNGPSHGGDNFYEQI